MAERKLYQAIASVLDALVRSKERGNTDWVDKWEDRLSECESMLPHGSGFDAGTQIGVEESRKDRIVLHTAYHHMSNGFYEGWSEHGVIVTPSLIHGFDIRVTGRDMNNIKDYIAETLDLALRRAVGL